MWRAPVPARPVVARRTPSRSHPATDSRPGRGDASAAIASPSTSASATPSLIDVPFTVACSSLGHVHGTQRDEDRECRRRQCDPARRRGSRDQQRLQQVGAEQASPTDPERALHRHVAPARLRPHDQQSGHVGAGNQQQQRHAAQENEQGRFGVAEDVVRQRRHDHAPCAPPGEVRFPQSRHDDVHLRPPLSQRAARHQAADDVEDPEAALHASVHLILPEDAGQLPAYRSPYLGARRELERGRHDTNDGEWLPPRAHRHGFQPLPRRGKAITNELIDRLREDGAEHRPSPPANLRHV